MNDHHSNKQFVTNVIESIEARTIYGSNLDPKFSSAESDF